MGAIVGGADEKKIRMAEKYGKCIGIAFQVVDDILDVTSTDEELGKPVGSDMENNKSTYVSLLGIEKCREMVQNLTAEAIDALSAFDGDTAQLRELALKLAKRKK
jgi:geranylgeranyl diphosphate synthase type II